MKQLRRWFSIILVIALVAGFGVTASAADSITYVEAVDLLEDIVVNGESVLSVLGGSSLDGKAQQPLTKNEGIALINAFGREGRTWEPVAQDKELTGEEFFALVDRLLCTEKWFSDVRYVNANVNHYLVGLGAYEDIANRPITREEACQVLMNAMDAKVQFGDTWYFRDEFQLVHEYSADDSKTDEWKRPVGRWLLNGQAVTAWRTMTPVYEGQANINTHDLLEQLGYYEAGGFSNNQWINFHCYSNGGQRWDCGKLHWNHANKSGCHQNWISNRVGSKMEVYYLGVGVENIPDAGGDVSCQIYHVVFIDDYLAKIENRTISIYSNEGDAIWSWYDSRFPAANGYYITRINLKAGNDKAQAFAVQAPSVKRSSQQGMELPGSDGYNYVYTADGKTLVSSKCQLGFDIIGSMDYFNSGARVTFLYDTWGNVIGALDASFVDVAADAWYKEAVDFVDINGLMTGTGVMTFSPNEATTRAMIWTILARMDGVDTSGAIWYEAGQNWAIENGVSDGTDPNGLITREQLVTMLWRNAGEPEAKATLAEFTDAGSVSEWAVDALCWAVEAGVMQGSNGKLNPQNNATRAEVATMLMRY